MAKDKCDRFGNYDENDFECELCDQAEKCKGSSPKKKAAAKKKVVKKAAAKKKVVKKKVVKKKPTAEQKKAAVKKLASKKKKVKKPLKIKAEKPKEKVKKKVGKKLAKPEKKAVSAKEAKKRAAEAAVKINDLKDKTRTAFVNLVMKSAPLMQEVQEILTPDDFDKWCREKINYERSVCIRYIKAYKTFKDKPELLDSVDGQYKLFAVLAHPNPVKYLEKNQKKIADQTSREFRESVMKDRAKLLGDEDPGRKDPVELFIKFVKNTTTNLQGKFQDAKKLAKRKSLVLDAGAQEALKLNLEEINEWRSVIKDVLAAGKGKKK